MLVKVKSSSLIPHWQPNHKAFVGGHLVKMCSADSFSESHNRHTSSGSSENFPIFSFVGRQSAEILQRSILCHSCIFVFHTRPLRLSQFEGGKQLLLSQQVDLIVILPQFVFVQIHLSLHPLSCVGILEIAIIAASSKRSFNLLISHLSPLLHISCDTTMAVTVRTYLWGGLESHQIWDQWVLPNSNCSSVPYQQASSLCNESLVPSKHFQIGEAPLGWIDSANFVSPYILHAKD